MKTKFKKVLFTMTLILAFTIAINADSITQTIEVTLNSINLTVNGEIVEADTILYEGTTYVPLRTVSEMLDKDVTWDATTKTAGIMDKVQETKNEEPVKEEPVKEELKDEEPVVDATLGTRSNPVPIGEKFVVESSSMFYGDFKLAITVNEVLRGSEAENKVIKTNPYNNPSGSSNEYIIPNITVELIDVDESIDYYNKYGFDDYHFTYVNDSGKEYDELNYVVLENNLTGTSIYKGGTATGDDLELIAEGEKVLLKYKQYWFMLD